MLHTPLRLPDAMRRDEVGPYIASLREHFGLSHQDVADRLHLRARYIYAIENSAFEQLPGVVYARGFVHSYAEFLGLDAGQVVEICFGAEPVDKPVAPPAPIKKMAKPARDIGQWRNLAVLTLGCAIVLLIAVQFHHRTPETLTAAPETVPPVPEELLTTHHKMVMPTPVNLDCLLGDEWSACLRSTRVWRLIDSVEHPAMIVVNEPPEADEVASDDGDDADEVKKPAKTETKKKPEKSKSHHDDKSKKAAANWTHKGGKSTDGNMFDHAPRDPNVIDHNAIEGQ